MLEEVEKREAATPGGTGGADYVLSSLAALSAPALVAPAVIADSGSQVESSIALDTGTISFDTSTVPATEGADSAVADALFLDRSALEATTPEGFVVATTADFGTGQDEAQPPPPFTPAPGDEFAQPFDPSGTPAASNGHATAPAMPPSPPPNLAGASAGGAGAGGVSTSSGGGGGSGGGGSSAQASSNTQVVQAGLDGAFGPLTFTILAAPTTAASGSVPAATLSPATATTSASQSAAALRSGPSSGHIKPLTGDPPLTVQFQSATTSVNESNGVVDITITLSAAATQTVSVNYATSDGTATAGTDYAATSGTLSFPAGTTQEFVGVPISDDNLNGETSPETFTLTLSNPSGATLGSPSTNQVSITEDSDPSSKLQWVNNNPTLNWTQSPTAPPQVTTPAAQTNTEGNTVSLPISASDPHNYPLTYDAVGLPPGLSINSTTGVISGTVSYSDAADFGGSYTPTVIVANNQGGSTQTSFTWTVNQAQVAPTLTNPGSQSNLRGDNVSLQINASQVDGDQLTYSATNLPTGLSIDSGSGLISGTVDPSSTLGTPYSVTVTATDDTTNLAASQTFNWTINATNVAPVLTSPGNQSNAAGDVVSLQLSASDADGDPLTYTATGLPAGLTLDPIGGLISGTLPNSAASSTPYSVTVTASDGLAKNSQTFTWTVSAVSLPSPGDQSNLDGDSVSLQLTATDANNSTLTYSATGLPSGLTISSSTGLISGTISNTADTNSPYAVTVTATDTSNYSASQSFNWTVARLALNPVNDQENQEGTAVSLQLSSTDHLGTPTYSATGLPSGLSISSTTGLISGTLGAADHGSSPYQVTVTASDGSKTSSQSFVWTVTPRVALINPGSRGNAVGDSVSLQLSATSPGGTMSYSASGLPPGLSISSSTGLISGTPTTASATPYTVTVTANDGTSSSSQSFAWTVAAIWIAPPAAPTNLDGDTVSLPLTTAYHGSGTLSYTATGLPAGLNINAGTGTISGTIANTADTNSPYSVTVTATAGGNTGTQTFNWTVNPRVTIDPLTDQSNAVGDTVSLQVTASDALSSTLSYSATNLPSGLTISSTTGLISGTIGLGADTSSPYAVTVTVTDSAGVSATQSFNWTVAHVALVNPGPQWSVDSHAVSLQLQGSDADHDVLSWTASGLPSTLSISSTGLISGTLASNADASSPYVVTVTANDGTHSTSQTFLWTVSQVGLTVPSNQTNTEGDNVSLQLQGLASSGSLSYSASGLPNGLSLNPTTGLISGTIAPGAAANGPFTVDVSASNGTDSVSQTFTWTVNPVVTLTVVADQSNVEGNSVSLQVSATDSKGASLSYTAQGLPLGLSMSSTGLITGTITSGDAANGPYAVTVTASDGTYSSNETFTWTVTHTDTTALAMTKPGTQTNVAGDSVNVQVNASDPDGIDSLTYTATGLPDGVNIDPFSGIISGTVADDAVSNAPYQATVTAADGNGQTVSQAFNWLINAAPITVQAQAVSAVEDTDTGSITVATFTTPDLNSQASAFVAAVNWGDGNSDVGTVTGQNGSFTVTDDYTYAEKGSYPVSVTITDTATGGSAKGSSTATVTDAALTLSGGLQLGAIQQQSASWTLATFTDGNSNAAASDYTVTINWGDNTGTQPGTVGANVDGVFGVQGSHTYGQDGTYTVTLTLTDVDGNTATATSTVAVGDVYAGELSNLTVASFTDSDGNTQQSAYTAIIHWGDGTQSSGTVTGSNGVFSVQGSHSYTVDSLDQPGGVYQVNASITDTDGDTLTGNGTVEVVRPPMSLAVGSVAATAGLALSNVEVAAFTEPDTSDTASEFSALINWGDGTALDPMGSVVGSNGIFHILGNHTYAVSGTYPISVVVLQGWQGEAPAAGGNAQGATPTKPLSISGPRSVPGNSIYSFTINYTNWANDKFASFSMTGTGGVGVYALDSPKPTTIALGIKRPVFTVYFPNQPAELTITAKYVSGIEASITVNVIQVTVKDPPGGSFKTGTPEDDPAPVKTTANLQYPYVFKGISSAAPKKAGFAWKANVSLAAKNDTALSAIEVGFVQHVSVQAYDGFYGEQKPKAGYLISYMVKPGYPTPGGDPKLGYVDVATPRGVKTRDPFYSIITPEMFQGNPPTLPKSVRDDWPAGVVTRAIFTGADWQSANIGSFDTPEAAVPWSWNYTSPPPPRPPYVQKMTFKFVFTLDVVAHNVGQGVYWPYAEVKWIFEGTDAQLEKGATLPWNKKTGNVKVYSLTNTWQPVLSFLSMPVTGFPLGFAIPENTYGGPTVWANNILYKGQFKPE